MKKKVLIVINSIDGGTGTFLLQILKLNKIFDFYIFALEKPQYRKISFIKKIKFITVPKKIAGITFTPFLMVRFLLEFYLLKNYIKNHKPEIILAIDTHCNLLAAMIKVCFYPKTPLILTNHNNISAVVKAKLFFPFSTLIKVLGRFFFNRAEKTICVSKGVARDMKKFFSLKKMLEVIHYGIDLSAAIKKGHESLDKHERPLFDTNLSLLSIGRFEPQKDFFTLIKAFALIQKKVKTSRLILIGDGPEKKKLQKLVTQLQLKNAVFFLGWKQNIYPYLKHSDIFIMSSHYEGFGYVLLEAFSQKTPIIATDAPYGPSEVLENGKYGKLVPLKDPQYMANVILEFYRNKLKIERYKLNVLTHLDSFQEQKMIDKYKHIFSTLSL